MLEFIIECFFLGLVSSWVAYLLAKILHDGSPALKLYQTIVATLLFASIIFYACIRYDNLIQSDNSLIENTEVTITNLKETHYHFTSSGVFNDHEKRTMYWTLKDWTGDGAYSYDSPLGNIIVDTVRKEIQIKKENTRYFLLSYPLVIDEGLKIELPNGWTHYITLR